MYFSPLLITISDTSPAVSSFPLSSFTTIFPLHNVLKANPAYRIPIFFFQSAFHLRFPIPHICPSIYLRILSPVLLDYKPYIFIIYTLLYFYINPIYLYYFFNTFSIALPFHIYFIFFLLSSLFLHLNIFVSVVFIFSPFFSAYHSNLAINLFIHFSISAIIAT